MLLAADGTLESKRMDISSPKVFGTRLIGDFPILSSVRLGDDLGWDETFICLQKKFEDKFRLVIRLCWRNRCSKLTDKMNDKAMEILRATESDLDEVLRLPIVEPFLDFVKYPILYLISD